MNNFIKKMKEIFGNTKISTIKRKNYSKDDIKRAMILIMSDAEIKSDEDKELINNFGVEILINSNFEYEKIIVGMTPQMIINILNAK